MFFENPSTRHPRAKPTAQQVPINSAHHSSTRVAGTANRVRGFSRASLSSQAPSCRTTQRIDRGKKREVLWVTIYCPSDISQEIEGRKPTLSRAATRKSWYWSGGTGAGMQNFALSSPPKHCKIRLSLRKNVALLFLLNPSTVRSVCRFAKMWLCSFLSTQTL